MGSFAYLATITSLVILAYDQRDQLDRFFLKCRIDVLRYLKKI